MLRIIRMVNALLNAHERRRAIQVFCLMLLVAFLEVLGIASIMPFVAVLANAEIVESNVYLAGINEALGFDDPQFLLILLAGLALGVFVASLALKAVTIYALTRYSTMRLHSISCRLLTAYLSQPYAFFLQRNTANLAKSVLSEVGKVTNGVLTPMLRVLSGLVVAAAILIFLLFVEPLLSITVAGFLGGAFVAVYLTTRNLLNRIGADRVSANESRFVLANEALGGIKELQLMGRSETYLQRFQRPSERYARHQATSKMIGDLPQYGIQVLAFGAALLSVVYLQADRGGIEEALPLISLYAFAGYRLMPALQLIFSNMTRLRFSIPALEALYKDLSQKEAFASNRQLKEQSARVRLNGALRMKNVNFIYPSVDTVAVKNLSLEIPRGASVAFVGSTGAGKSTVVDLILGLLEPSEGEILIDDQIMKGPALRGWQKNIGYVPQATYLADDSIAANIAFGIAQSRIDLEAVEKAARAAHIHDFVVKQLPKGYETIVGERGVRLSGGQRQRLAIARALYHDPEVVVFDEATSALDNATEAVVMEAIEALRGDKTVIIIAHRFSTVEKCDRIYVLRGGELVAGGTYDELLESNSHFKNLVNAGAA